MSTFTGALSETKIHLVFHVCRGCKKTLTKAEFCDACLAIHASLKAPIDSTRVAVYGAIIVAITLFWGWLAVHAWRWL